MNFLEKNKDITSLSNFKTKAFARYYFEINYEEDLKRLIEIIAFASNQKLKVLFI
jgi:hypothetical protein